ncbi:hypothetical protein [Xenorhabdus innexi]|uniref:Uncharacterized protein n=1 Tax=Xenorhabdus innexi TaxID=290109 RepID=A0A1N6N0V9_9GAMM|nr:hypothetical protein [Xenorhabdus innexi]PHM31312.1 hypothetical protein Xinn_02858 [Xenorhabdus innexi]SIP74763.1 hypothetical protein XIS1_840032 [Xenorhabdus innexi]
MSKLTLTISGLNENNTASSVDFKAWQGDRLLIKDTLNGKVSEGYKKVYDTECTHEPVIVEHNRDDLPSLKITASIA